MGGGVRNLRFKNGGEVELTVSGFCTIAASFK